jgi:hypothetical protein
LQASSAKKGLRLMALGPFSNSRVLVQNTEAALRTAFLLPTWTIEAQYAGTMDFVISHRHGRHGLAAWCRGTVD